MGYPTSVFSPAVRTNGQTIDAAHVNDLQTEVTAVQTALLGTITHSVNVSGASTLATLQAAASTFSVRPVIPQPDAVRVSAASTLAIGSSAASTITWLAQTYITNSSMHSLGANQERLVPQSTGFYQISAQLRTDTPSSGARQLSIIDSSAGVIARVAVCNSTHELTMNITGYKRFDVVGGYVTVRLVTDASSHSIVAGGDATWAAMHKLY